MTDHSILISKMIAYYTGDPKRIHHFIKVHSFAKTIGELERLDDNTQFILETAAIVHDIGIKISEEKYGSSAGKYQEQEGPDVAKTMLESLHYSVEVIERVLYLIAHHHTYSNITGLDYRVLVEADFLVNIYEDGLSTAAAANSYHSVFRTETGKRFCRELFNLNII